MSPLSPPGQAIAHALVNSLNFKADLPAPVAAIREGSTLCLGRQTGTSLEIMCVYDRIANPDALAPSDIANATLLGDELLLSLGSASAAQTVIFLFVEIAEVAMTQSDHARLDTLQSGGNVVVKAIYIDASTPLVWSNQESNWTSFFTHLLGGELTREAPTSEQPAVKEPLPSLTIALLVALVVIFGIEFLATGSFDPNARLLFALGGSSSEGVNDGEWFRILTATLLHSGFIHLVCNAVALWVGGVFIESLVGKRWLFVIYTISAITGSLLGLAINDARVVSVGASGAIMGVLAAAFALTVRLPKGEARTSILGQLARILIPSLIPFATHGGGRVDVAAHVGGALGGALVGGLLGLAWKMDREPLPLPRIGTALTVVSSTLFIGAMVAAIPGYPARAAEARFDPSTDLLGNNVIPDDVDEATKTVETWGTGHNRDPRVHYYRALKYVGDNRLADAERELRMALAEKSILKQYFKRELEVMLRELLCGILKDENKLDEARLEAAPVCKSGLGGSVPEHLKELGLCGAR